MSNNFSDVISKALEPDGAVHVKTQVVLLPTIAFPEPPAPTPAPAEGK